jgi:hypothetical protein
MGEAPGRTAFASLLLFVEQDRDPTVPRLRCSEARSHDYTHLETAFSQDGSWATDARPVSRALEAEDEQQGVVETAQGGWSD